MSKLRVSLAVALVTIAAAGEARAQDGAAKPFDIGIYAGGVYLVDGEFFGAEVRGVGETDLPVADLGLRGEVGYGRLLGKNGGPGINLLTAALNVTYPVAEGFLIGAGGAVHVDKASCQECDSRTNLGVNVFGSVPLIPGKAQLQVGVDVFNDNELARAGVLLFLP